MSNRMPNAPKIDALFEVARKVLDSETSDREAIMVACDVLEASERWSDIIRVRYARACLGQEFLETRTLIDDELRAGGAYSNPMAPYFEEPEIPEVRRRGRCVLALVFVGFVLAVVAHVIFATPGKIARTLELYHQLEEVTE